MIRRFIFLCVLCFFIIQNDISDVVYVDETGVNQHYQREHGRSKRGSKVQDTKRGKRFKRTNIIGALRGKEHLAVQCYEHSTIASFFEDWFEFELIPLLKENSLVVMDNASFHNKKRLLEIANKYGIILLFLPPYSPDYNPIEHSWANFKRWLKDNIKRFSNFDWAIQCYFYDLHSFSD